MRGKFKGKRGGGASNKRKFKPQRKTYSLYKSKNDKSFKKKRRFSDTEGDNKEKRYKKEDEEIATTQETNTQPDVPSSSEEEEEIDDMQQLLKTFKNVKPQVAIDSSSEESEDIEEDDDDEEVKEIDKSNDTDEEIENDHNSEKDEKTEEEDNLDDNNKDENIPEEKESDEEFDEIQISNEIEEDTTDTIDDPFSRHCLYQINESLLNSVESSPPKIDSFQETWPELGKLNIHIPKCEKSQGNEINSVSITDTEIYAPGGKVPQKISCSKNTLEDLFIKKQIINNIKHANKLVNSEISEKMPLTHLQAEIFSVLNNYQDLYYPQRTFENGEEIRFAYCLHVMNHIIKTRLKVIHHNSRLSGKDDVPEEFRDQGLVRPKVLIILPFRDAAYRVINMLIDILIDNNKGNVMNKNRFEEEFTGGELIMPKKNPKPEDYELLFTGNSNDDFKIGITVTKKALKLYADFYSSDIIIASPLGLRPIIGAEGEPQRDYDFLASIELLILDQTDVFLMQNWDHLLHIFKHLHMQPKDSHGTNFLRVRMWSLNGWAKYYRQTLIFSSVQLPEINSIFNKQCCNYAGKVKIANPIAFGSIRQVYVQVPHVYYKFNVATSADAIEARFQFFINKILPQQRDTTMKHTLIYVANYFDYVRLRNYFKKEDIGFVQICEYSKDAKIARARDMFFHGDAHFLLYTERYHFFNRKRIKGIRQLLFYQPPTIPHFYYEMCNLMQEANMNKKIHNESNMSVNVMYSKYDIQQLSAIVGTERAIKMVNSDREVHMLLTDS